MATYSLSSRNQLRSPSGAVGEPPDGPGGIAALRDDIDNILGVGGAEYCANAAALTAIPTSRLFVGKRAYRADQDIEYRYVGAGNTALAGNDTTSKWQAWSKPATAFTPNWAGALTVGASTQMGRWGISEGTTWVELAFTAGTGYALSTTVDLVMTLPSPVLGSTGGGSGQYQRGGTTGANNQAALAPYAVGTAGTSSSALRIRALYTNAAPGGVNHNIAGSVIASTATDGFQIHFAGPSALVA